MRDRDHARWAGLVLLAALATGAQARGQEPSTIQFRDTRILFSGPSYGFRAADREDRWVFCVLDGVEVLTATRRMRADRLVAVLARDEEPADDAAEPVLSDRRLVELFLEGHVFLEEGDEQVVGAEALYLDNLSGLVTIAEGSIRADEPELGGSLIVRFERMRALTDGTRELSGVTYTNCDYDHAHWGFETDWARIDPTPDGRVLSTGPSTVRVGDVPVLWWPGTRVNMDTARLPIRGLDVGSSTRFGTQISTYWGGDVSPTATSVAELFGHEGTVDAELGLEVSYFSRRGVFVEPTIEYETDDSSGKLLMSYIRDSADRDRSIPPDATPGTMPSVISVDHRFRIDLEHRTRIDDTKTLDIELSEISDRNYLNEYYEGEFREGKEQESYVNYRDVEDNEAFQILARIRLNGFQDQVEYLPQLERRVVGESVGDVLFGEAFVSTRDILGNARYRPDDDDDVPGLDPFRHWRVGRQGRIDWPLDLENGDRVLLTGTADLTWFSDSNGHGATTRTSTGAGLLWARTYSGVDPDAHSETWNIAGLRRIVEPYVGYQNVFHLSRSQHELVPNDPRTMMPLQIDEVEELARQDVLTVGVRDRIQTHQEGEVVTVLDTEVMVPFFFDPGRDNDGSQFDVNGDGRPTSEVEGNVFVDTVWRPGAHVPGLRNAQLNWRALLDPNTRTYRESFLGFRSAIDEDRSFLVAHNTARNVFDYLTLGGQWVLTPKWSVAAFYQRDLRLDEDAWIGFILRQQAHRWYIDLEVSRRRNESFSGNDRDDQRISINLRPAYQRPDEDLLERVSRRIR